MTILTDLFLPADDPQILIGKFIRFKPINTAPSSWSYGIVHSLNTAPSTTSEYYPFTLKIQRTDTPACSVQTVNNLYRLETIRSESLNAKELYGRRINNYIKFNPDYVFPSYFMFSAIYHDGMPLANTYPEMFKAKKVRDEVNAKKCLTEFKRIMAELETTYGTQLRSGLSDTAFLPDLVYRLIENNTRYTHDWIHARTITTPTHETAIFLSDILKRYGYLCSPIIYVPSSPVSQEF